MQHPKPQIAVITEDVLTGIGLKSMLEEIIPFAEIKRFLSIQEAMGSKGEGGYFHFFIGAKYYMEHTDEMEKVGCSRCIVFGTAQEKELTRTCSHYISTNVPQEALTKALMALQQHAHHQFSHYPNEISRQLKQEDERQTALLTKREIEVLKMVAKGKSSKEIADEMHISLYTVNTHRKNIMDKLEAHSATKIMAYALNHGYMDL